ncbi:hypothetical protein DY000_02002203 [Brassica cretica]|uniref:Uncharacterized protein n=1 Tax=Brassica cretica TaxID=69181 RepID=A0ABQ7CDR3_BRACR|nr:hypothetical protein DY000_02002203 [Brassica cretica]
MHMRESLFSLESLPPPNSLLILAPPTSDLCFGGGDHWQACRVGLFCHRRYLVSGSRLSLFRFSVRLNLFAWCLWISPPGLAETKGVLGFSGALARPPDLCDVLLLSPVLLIGLAPVALFSGLSQAKVSGSLPRLMIPSPRILKTTYLGGVLAWRSSSCSPFVQPADGESPTLCVFLFPLCILPVVAYVPTLDVFAASFRSRGRYGFVCSASSSCGASEPLPAASVEATLSLRVSVRPNYPLLAILSISPGD